MKKLNKAVSIGTLAVFSSISLIQNASAVDNINTQTGVDTARNCVHNGFHYKNSNDIAPTTHCFATEDNSNIKPLATVNKNKTKADLEKIENTSPLNPNNYLAKDTFAYKKLTGNEKVSPFSREISRTTTETNYNKNVWMTGANGGGFDNHPGFLANESIPIFTVDSSNPYQHYVNISSNDGRVISSKKNTEMMTGKIPLPEWYKPSTSGDHSIAIYDVATGIWRSLFYFVPKKDSSGKPLKDSYEFASGGYMYGEPNFKGLNDRNYWMSLVFGTSSVVGLSNELTQIGVDEIRSGKINHAISMTWEDYQQIASFPAKMADGTIDPKQYPFTPHAGQRFWLPKDFNVDQYCTQNQVSPVLRMILHAVQDYGGIITDRNLFTNAFNFENPTGYAQYARQGKNVYLDDPVINKKFENFNSHIFPIDKLKWAELNYMDDTTNKPIIDNIVPKINFSSTKNDAYQPDATYTTIYQGQKASERLITNQQMSPNITNRVSMYKKDVKDVNGLIGELTNNNGVFSILKDNENIFIPNNNFIGTTNAYYTNSFWQKANSKFDYEEPTNGTVTVHKPTEKVLYNGNWIINVVPKNQPIARSDEGWLAKNSEKSFNVISNDQSSFNSVSNTVGSKDNDPITKIKLLDSSGKEINSYTDNYGTYSINGTTIKVKAKSNVGYTPIVRYKAVTQSGKTSQTGYLQPLIVDTAENLSKPASIVTSSPKAANDSITTNYQTAKTFNPLSNDSINSNSKAVIWKDVYLLDSKNNKVKSLTNSYGKYTVNSNKSVTFTPNKTSYGKVAPDISYTAIDSLNHSTTAKISTKITLNQYLYFDNKGKHYILPKGTQLFTGSYSTVKGVRKTVIKPSTTIKSNWQVNGYVKTTPVNNSYNINEVDFTGYYKTFNGSKTMYNLVKGLNGQQYYVKDSVINISLK